MEAPLAGALVAAETGREPEVQRSWALRDLPLLATRRRGRGQPQVLVPPPDRGAGCRQRATGRTGTPRLRGQRLAQQPRWWEDAAGPTLEMSLPLASRAQRRILHEKLGVSRCKVRGIHVNVSIPSVIPASIVLKSPVRWTTGGGAAPERRWFRSSRRKRAASGHSDAMDSRAPSKG